MEPNLGERSSSLDARLASYTAEKQRLRDRIANPVVPPEKTERRRQRLAHLENVVIPRTVRELQHAPQ